MLIFNILLCIGIFQVKLLYTVFYKSIGQVKQYQHFTMIQKESNQQKEIDNLQVSYSIQINSV